MSEDPIKKFTVPGVATSVPEITPVSRQGFWRLLPSIHQAQILLPPVFRNKPGEVPR